jgi:pyridoxamine 5'-phosphate oxidase
MNDVDIAALRQDYARGGLDRPDLADDPIAMFGRWMRDAVAAGLHEPNAMVVSTVGADGRPSSRMVLLKGVGEEGLVFYTNHASRKGEELAANPHCSLLFPWHPLERQVRIDGTAEVLDRPRVEAYFRTRPRGAQLGAWASDQSRPVASRAELEASYARVEERYADADVPVPPHWGGYRVVPESIEFWQGQVGRLHDRFRYSRGDDGRWRATRLGP